MLEVENKDKIGWEAKNIAGTPKLSINEYPIFSLFVYGFNSGSVTNIGCSFISCEFIPNFEYKWLNTAIISCSFSNTSCFTGEQAL